MYGIVHDEITYSISKEYYTRLKFLQFHYANFGLPVRVFAAEVGFLATWWVGFIAAWFLARVTVPSLPKTEASSCNLIGFLIIILVTVSASVTAFFLGLLHGPDYSAWRNFTAELGVSDVRNFVRVAYIHYGSYLGGLIGLIAALIFVRSRTKKNSSAENQAKGTETA